MLRLTAALLLAALVTASSHPAMADAQSATKPQDPLDSNRARHLPPNVLTEIQAGYVTQLQSGTWAPYDPQFDQLYAFGMTGGLVQFLNDSVGLLYRLEVAVGIYDDLASPLAGGSAGAAFGARMFAAWFRFSTTVKAGAFIRAGGEPYLMGEIALGFGRSSRTGFAAEFYTGAGLGGIDWGFRFGTTFPTGTLTP